MIGCMWIGYIIGACSVAAWIYLVWFRGGFWRVAEESEAPETQTTPSVIAIVPARNEETLIGQSIGSLLAQDYPGPFQVFLVDDHSSDGTAGAAGRHNRLTIAAAGDKPDGWTGKLWAVSQGLKLAEPWQPDYYLLTDADILHSPETVSRLVARSEAAQLDLVSWMVKLR